MTRWKTILLALAVAVPAGALPAAAVPAAAASPVPPPASPAPPAPIENGETQPVYSRADALTETVFVEVAGTDSDADGRPDRVAVDIMRPKETAEGLKVPVIMEASPYYAGGNDVANHVVDLDGSDPAGMEYRRNKFNDLREEMFGQAEDPAAARAAAGPFPGYYDNFFVPRGYAIALVENVGSGRATGCPTTGLPNETAGPKAAIDWLNGRAKGFDAAGNEIRADWSTGNVGMIGVSYNGTLPNAVAATGVRGLKTIVPIAAISSWYDYYRAGGGVVAPGGYQGEDADVLARYVLTRQNGQEVCGALMDRIEQDQDRVTGDYSRFWHERNYLPDVRKVRASVFLVHGLNDWNVKTEQAVQWWDALARHGVPRKIWLHQGAHFNPFSFAQRNAEWLRQLHRWFDFHLYGLRNGIMDEPQADVEHGPGQWAQHAAWPLPGTRDVRLRLAAGTAGQNGTLSPHRRHGHAVESFTDQNTRTAEQLAENATATDPNRLAYLSEPVARDVRLSGTPEVSVRAAFKNGRSPYLTALLVDYGTDARAYGRVAYGTTPVCYGQGVPGDTGCARLAEHVTVTAPFKIITRGWLDVRNRNSESRTELLREGRFYDFDVALQPSDYVVKAGHRIGVVLISTDYDFTLRLPAGTEVSVEPGDSSVTLPLVGGRSALG
ncbi:Xaa-Pro dipeptidyl-peptidase [Planomonospora venezuelensis]|uniref:Xaa-Pro dipeptidyl-peptidase n=1 Tax=Planomonospora venezuelensis TaxID=1999 RepID=A0A841DCJ9_PLAVE|nr:Xaa-Pro dipeptidyl-peptidase [Planomonospora venezuelensis]MBB5966174.1 X-Pro dipeptidyl-peptidase [Planomonospora venezuelensis]GIN01951.1 Xaa-Pro dipeptidyl-peptidase [Planomonospora venezuelensis]